MAVIADDSISIILRLFLNAIVRFGAAGLGITIVCILRKEKFTQLGLAKKNNILPELRALLRLCE